MKTKLMNLKQTALVLAVGAAVTAMTPAKAEQSQDTTAPFSTAANLDFRVVIPTFLRLRIGSAGAVIDLVDFDMSASAANVGNGVAQARTNGGTIPVSIAYNGGTTASVVATAPATGLLSGANAIPYSEIGSSSDNANFNSPTLVNGASAPVAIGGGAGGTVVQTANWTFTYANTNVVPGGTYGGAATASGRVVYTATAP